MSSLASIGAEPIVLALPPACDLASALSLAADIGAALLRNPQSVVVDGAAVERVCTACIQVLLAADLEANAAKRRLAIENPSAPLSSAFASLGLERRLEQLSAPRAHGV